MRYSSPRNTAQEGKLSATLGWFSLILGASEVLAPGWVARRIGVAPDRRATVRWQGVREMLTGAAILRNPSSPGGIWARVGGDVIDLAILANASDGDARRNDQLRRSRRLVGAITALDVACAASLSRSRSSQGSAKADLSESIAIEKPADELYKFWRSFDRLPEIMNYLESVTVLDERRSHWVAKPVGNIRLEWDCEIVSDEPNRRIAWKSTPESQISTEGSVRFDPLEHERGTRVSVEMSFALPRLAPRLVQPLSRLAAQVAVRRDLRRFKQRMETGEVATVRGQPAGRPSGDTWLDRLASA